jgi:hypothetical protein
MQRSDYYMVESTVTGEVVSSMCLIPQVWAYEDIPFGVGRPELVATLPAYRRRGLVRAQFEALHADCAARDLPVQGITGINYFYRRFGYEYALGMGGGCHVYLDAVPKLSEGEDEPYTARPATPDDIPAIMEMAADHFGGLMVTCRRDARVWRHLLREESCVDSPDYYMLAAADDGALVGYFALADDLWAETVNMLELVLAVGVPYTGALPSVMRAAKHLAETTYATPEGARRKLRCRLGQAHPAYDLLADYDAAMRDPYAWYIRVSDLPGFLKRIRPVLERRLAGSPVAGYTGEVKVTFYSEPGVRLKLDAGRLVKIASTDPADEDESAGFPPGVFLKLLFGYRNFEELRDAFPDVWAGRDERTLLEALFPKRLSWVRPIE